MREQWLRGRRMSVRAVPLIEKIKKIYYNYYRKMIIIGDKNI